MWGVGEELLPSPAPELMLDWRRCRAVIRDGQIFICVDLRVAEALWSDPPPDSRCLKMRSVSEMHWESDVASWPRSHFKIAAISHGNAWPCASGAAFKGSGIYIEIDMGSPGQVGLSRSPSRYSCSQAYGVQDPIPCGRRPSWGSFEPWERVWSTGAYSARITGTLVSIPSKAPRILR